PLRTARSVVHPREAKLDRLQRQVIEASKQCGRNVLMKVEPLTDWEGWCARAELPGDRVLGHPGAAEGFGAPRKAGGLVVAVGPEGGFTDDEVTRAAAHGWRRVGLGPRVLRVETAAVALAVLASAGSRP